MVNNAVAVGAPDETVDEIPLDGPPNMTHEDVEAVNRRLKHLRDYFGNLRFMYGSFRLPWPLTRTQYEELRNHAIDSWLNVMSKKGWELKSKVHIKGPFPAYGYSSDWQSMPVLDQQEFRAKAAFQKTKVEPKRIEVLVQAEGGLN